MMYLMPLEVVFSAIAVIVYALEIELLHLTDHDSAES